MLADWNPSLRIESHCLLPVEIRKQRFLTTARSAEVMKPPPFGWKIIRMCTFRRSRFEHTKHFLTASLTFSTLTSENPRILSSCLLWSECTACWNTVNDGIRFGDNQNGTYRHGVQARSFQLQDVALVDAMRLQLINVDNQALILN